MALIKARVLTGVLVFLSTGCREEVPPRKSVAELNEELAARMLSASAAEIEPLLKQGASPDAKNAHGLPVIFLAARRGDAAIAESLIKAGADVSRSIGTTYNEDGAGYSGTTDGTPMGYAASAGKVKVMEALLKAGAKVNGRGPGGTSPLMQAAEGSQLEAVEWLLQHGATAGRSGALRFCEMNPLPDERQKRIVNLLRDAADGDSGK